MSFNFINTDEVAKYEQIVYVKEGREYINKYITELMKLGVLKEAVRE